MNLHKELLDALKPLGDPQRAKHDRGYVNTQLDLLGCNMPAIRSVTKQFSGASDAELEAAWNASNSFDVLYSVLIIFGNRTLTERDWPRLKRWSRKIDNWAHSDTLSEMIARLVESHPKQIYPDLQAWNTSKNPWQRRLSLTSLLYYHNSRSHRLPTSKILPLVKARLHDEDIYVQKAVGWTLRESGNGDPEKTSAFIKKHLNELSAIAFSAATEKWSKKEKDQAKLARKSFRKQTTYARKTKTK